MPENEEKPKPKPLPMFRKDIVVYQGPYEPDGTPTFNLYDAVTGQYYKITWAEAKVIETMRSGMTSEDLAKKINETTTLHLTPLDIEQFFMQAHRLKLLNLPRTSEAIMDEAEKAKVEPLRWLLFHYLFFRVPLIHPDRFLKRTLKYVEPLVSKTAFVIYVSLTLIGILMLVGQFQEYLHTFTYFFNLEGIVTYGIAISCVKLIHEFAHAYTAKYYKIHVPTMGVAFLVLWPVLYTDVTDSWKLAERKKRLAISAAGVTAEMIVAGLCTLGWALTEQGLLNSAFFIISSVTWITSLFININPALRYDGYYILCDLWGIDNMQQRAFAVTRWKFREWFLGMKTPCPEERLGDKMLTKMVIYAVYTFLYRLFLYTAIAIFVYYAFTKALGVFLFIIEILVFFLWPVVWEIMDLFAWKKYFYINPRFLTFTGVLICIFLWFALPLPHIESFPAITVPVKEQQIYVPFSGKVAAIYVKRGDKVTTGDPLLKIESLPLNTEIAKYQTERNILNKEIAVISQGDTQQDKDKSYYKEKLSELSATTEHLRGLISKQEGALIKAKLNGTILDLDQKLLVGQYVAENQKLGMIAQPEQVDVMCFVPEIYIHMIQTGQDVVFKIKLPPTSYKGKVQSINPQRSNILNYPPLASIYGGDLPTNKVTGETIQLVESYYSVRIDLAQTEQIPRFGIVGYVDVEGPWQSKASIYWKRFLSLLWRESGI